MQPLSNDGPDMSGDLPRPVRSDYFTSSVSLPKLPNLYTCRQYNDTATITQTQPAGAGYAYYFALSSLDGATNFTSLFDQYRIDAVRVTIVPTQTAIQITATAANTFVSIYTAIDYDDQTAPANIATIREYDNVMAVPPATISVRVFQPRIAVAAYSGAFTSFANMGPQWLDAGSPNIQHYGLKVWVPGGVAAQTGLQQWLVETEYYVSFRGVRG